MVKFPRCPWNQCGDPKRCAILGKCGAVESARVARENLDHGRCVPITPAAALAKVQAEVEEEILPGTPCMTTGGCPQIQACVALGKCALDPASHAKMAVEAAQRMRAQIVALPPIYAGVVGDDGKPLNEDNDARRWAREFMQAKQFIEERGEKLDESTMLAWFSNAIMCGSDETTRRLATFVRNTEETAKAMNEGWHKAIDEATLHFMHVRELKKARKWLLLFGVAAGAVIAKML